MSDKKKVEFKGVVERYGVGDLTATDVEVGGTLVIATLEEEFGNTWARRPAVKVFLGVEPLAEGPLWTCAGFGGTDVTPPDSPEIMVGDYDLLNKLTELDEREVLLIVEEL